MEVEKQECCPKFHPEKWNEKTFDWDHKKFIKATVPTFFHIPLPPMIGNR
ncbi:hydrolase, partial [Eudoraea sp.]